MLYGDILIATADPVLDRLASEQKIHNKLRLPVEPQRAAERSNPEAIEYPINR